MSSQCGGARVGMERGGEEGSGQVRYGQRGAEAKSKAGKRCELAWVVS